MTVGWMLLSPANPFRPLPGQMGYVSGATLVMANCGHWAMCSPQGWRLFDSGTCYTICLNCDLQSAQSMFFGTVEGQRYSVPGVIEALERELPPHAMDQVRSYMKDHDVHEL